MPVMKKTAGLFLMLFTFSVFFACSPLKKEGSNRQSVSIPTAAQVGATMIQENIARIEAPFSMPQLKRPTFPAYQVSILSKGAKQNTKITQLIQQCIDETSARGGGKVIIPKGKWNTGRISLKSNVNLHLEEGAQLYFSGEIADYLPAVFTRFEGVELMSLGACIYANGQENIAVTGKGKLIGPAQGGSVRKQVMESDVIENVVLATTPVEKRVYEGHNGSPIFLPLFISPINCKNVLVEGLSLENTACWNIVPIYCENVIIRGVTVNSVGIPRGDGIDIESSRNVLIEYCTLSTGDDCFTIKAGRGDDGLRVNKPTENVVIRYCLAKKGHGGITCGSETASMIRNVSVQDCVFDDTRVGIRFKTRRTRGGGGENLYYERIRLTNMSATALDWDMLGSATYVGKLASRYPLLAVNKLTPKYTNITVRDIIAENVEQFVRVNGIPESPLKNVTITNANVKTKKIFSATDADGITLKNSKIEATDPTITLLDARGIKFDNVQFIVPTNQLNLNISGDYAQPPLFKNILPKNLILNK